MRLTHHHKSSRSFIIIVTVVLCVVFTALVMTRIQRLYNLEAPQLQITKTAAPSDEEVNLDYISSITEWEMYEDNEFPLQIEIPKGWELKPNFNYSVERHLELKTPEDRTVIRIFISDESYIAVEGLDGDIIETSTGDDVINFDGLIYATKVGNLYYTYDGTGDLNAKSVLAKIVDTARYEN